MIIFIDECDTIMSKAAKTRVGALARLWERGERNLLVVGATNKPWAIEDKLLSTRFTRKIQLTYPEPKTRRELIDKLLAKEPFPPQLSEVELATIVDQARARSPFQLHCVVSEAVAQARDPTRAVTKADFDAALRQVRSNNTRTSLLYTLLL